MSSGLTEWTVSPGGGDVALPSCRCSGLAGKPREATRARSGGPQQGGHRVPAGDFFHHNAPECT